MNAAANKRSVAMKHGSLSRSTLNLLAMIITFVLGGTLIYAIPESLYRVILWFMTMFFVSLASKEVFSLPKNRDIAKAYWMPDENGYLLVWRGNVSAKEATAFASSKTIKRLEVSGIFEEEDAMNSLMSEFVERDSPDGAHHFVRKAA